MYMYVVTATGVAVTTYIKYVVTATPVTARMNCQHHRNKEGDMARRSLNNERNRKAWLKIECRGEAIDQPDGGLATSVKSRLWRKHSREKKRMQTSWKRGEEEVDQPEDGFGPRRRRSRPTLAPFGWRELEAWHRSADGDQGVLPGKQWRNQATGDRRRERTTSSNKEEKHRATNERKHWVENKEDSGIRSRRRTDRSTAAGRIASICQWSLWRSTGNAVT